MLEKNNTEENQQKVEIECQKCKKNTEVAVLDICNENTLICPNCKTEINLNLYKKPQKKDKSEKNLPFQNLDKLMNLD
ncbi:MAG: hypothetical protein N4A49_11825 [Marinifilaceae bacterium]|jgi:Zn finger protein HypA/HybF involved in hydrogenase expression|nr:hypothetical protein [Marinifilaceae bacterium]